MVPLEEISHLKPRKKKPLNQVASTIQKKGEINRARESFSPPVKAKKGLKKKSGADASNAFRQTDASAADPIAESLVSGGDYRTLRHKYLLLEEESFSLDGELSKVMGDVQSLEDEKSLLLDQLVVLEGLVDPRECKPQG